MITIRRFGYLIPDTKMEVVNVPTDFKPGCIRPVSSMVAEESAQVTEPVKKEEKKMIKVGAPAPDFELSGYHEGMFKNFRLSELKGKWVVLCFYPGDFTFV